MQTKHGGEKFNANLSKQRFSKGFSKTQSSFEFKTENVVKRFAFYAMNSSDIYPRFDKHLEKANAIHVMTQERRVPSARELAGECNSLNSHFYNNLGLYCWIKNSKTNFAVETQKRKKKKRLKVKSDKTQNGNSSCDCRSRGHRANN